MYIYSKRANVLVDKFTNHETSYDVINLGNSHGANINYGDINGKAFQRAGNTLYYDLQNYKYIAEHLKDGAVVIIPISYFSFGLDENRTDHSNPDVFVNDYYMYLPRKSIYKYSFKKNIQVYLYKIKENYDSVIDERFFLIQSNVKDTIPLAEKLESHALERTKTHKKMATYSDPEKNIKYLSLLIKEARANGHKPVIITMPFADNYNDKFGEAWLEQNYKRHLNSVLDTYNPPYFDYSEDERISPIDSFFRNSDHLSQKGRLFFSDILFEDLRKNQLLKK